MHVGRLIYNILAWLFLACIVVQVFIAGMAIFADPVNWSAHKTFVKIFVLIPLIMYLLTFVGRINRIHVNAITPGVIANTSNDRFKTEEIRKSIIAVIPLGWEGLPEDVAGGVLFLASDLSSFVTGETIEINGGMFMR
ncbi:SDR family oxidoreductase [Paenibacillus sp. SI8]|uniref:SDR family oxidoreductase n=1 Tax=unclassified Paenibacillus TaxID=185978 RepID=UPI0034664BFB